MPEHTVTFDHLIHWVDDLDTATVAYDDLGLPTTPALTMPGFRNAAWGVDDERYVELATVDDWDAVTTSLYAGSLGLLRPAIARHGPGPVAYAVDVPDARATASRLRGAGHDVEAIEVRFEDRDAGFVEVFIRDAPAHVPFFITYDPPRAEIARLRAAHRAEHEIDRAGAPDLLAVLARAADPEGEAERLASMLGLSAEGSRVALPGADIRFEYGEPAGLYGILVRSRSLDPDAGPFTVAGLTVVPER